MRTDRNYYWCLACIVIGFVIGCVSGALITRHEFWASGVRDEINEMRLTFKRVKVNQVKLEELIKYLEAYKDEITIEKIRLIDDGRRVMDINFEVENDRAKE